MTATEKNNVVRFGKVALEIGIILFAVGIAWATLNGRVDTNKGKIDTNSQTLKDHAVELRLDRDEMGVIKVEIREINVKQEYILDGIDEIKEKMK